MSYFDILAARAGAGGGTPTPPPVLIEKSVTQNGTYTASADEADGYSSVTVNVPNTYAAGDDGKVVQNGGLVSQTSTSVSQNGTINTTTNNSVTVSVQNTYTAQDEGKVVSNGALVVQGSDTVTENGTVDTTLISSLLVSVSGGNVFAKLTPQTQNVTSSDMYIFDSGEYIYVFGSAISTDSADNIGFSIPDDFDLQNAGSAIQWMRMRDGTTTTSAQASLTFNKTNRTISFISLLGTSNYYARISKITS